VVVFEIRVIDDSGNDEVDGCLLLDIVIGDGAVVI
jgi:hypothetical protein